MLTMIFDTETTGLVRNHLKKLDDQSSIIEFYGCVANLANGDIIEEYETLVKPPKPLPPEIVKITNLTDSMLENSPPFAAVADEIRVFIERAPVVLAHNFSFDQEMVDFEFERLGRKLNWPPAICSVEQSIILKGHRLTLTALHEFLFGFKFVDAHRAKVDVKALVKCCTELYKRELL